MAANDLKLYTRVEEFLYKIYPKLINFPKSEKFALCQEIKTYIYSLLTNISLANSVKSKRLYHCQVADGYLQTLKVLIKLSKKRRYISPGFYEELDLDMTEIGKMLSGYIKSTVKK